MIKGFKDFILRGNVVDLAVAIVIGGAFATVVNAFVVGIIGGILGAIGGSPSFGNAGFTINHSLINLGVVVNAIIYFVIVAAAIYFLVIVPVNHLAERRKRGEEPEAAAPAEDILLLQEIRDLLRQRAV
jgi:large conductance mechanosensitive channel